MPVITIDTITPGTRFSIQHPIEQYRAEGAGEEQFLKHFMGLLRPADIFFDIGASIGAWTVYCAPLCEKVYAFEPDPGLAQALSENIQVNDLQNVVALQYAVSDNDQGLEIFTSGRGGYSPSVVKREELGQKIHVPSGALDELVAMGRVRQPDVLKIDIEGAEYHALQGARKTLEKVRLICIELHPRQLQILGRSQESVLALLDDFEIVTRIECANEWNGDHLILNRKGAASGDPEDGTMDHQNQHGEELFQEGMYGQAEAVFQAIVAGDPANSRAHNNLGVVYCKTGKIENSIHHYRTAARLAPDNPVYLKNLADILFVAKDRGREALEIYNRILTANPEDPEALLAVGVISRTYGRTDDARLFFRRVLELDPENEIAKEMLATLEG